MGAASAFLTPQRRGGAADTEAVLQSGGPGVVAHLKPLGLDLVFGGAMSVQYDPDQHVDADTWLKFDESERIEAVKKYHRLPRFGFPTSVCMPRPM
jgi:hypothetical protein